MKPRRMQILEPTKEMKRPKSGIAPTRGGKREEKERE
jgi:hypothetical protein